jgi:hypothetical protein
MGVMRERVLIYVRGRSALAMAASVLALGAIAAGASTAQGSRSAPRADRASAPLASAALEECQTSSVQAERSATFAGEMTAVAGTVRMAMRIDLEERTPEQSLYHTVSAPGLGIWRLSDPKVKIYKYLKQVTNLSAPAVYRAVVRFRWLAPRGRVLKRVQRYTGGCTQPAPPAPPAPAGAEVGQAGASTPPASTAAPPAA